MSNVFARVYPGSCCIDEWAFEVQSDYAVMTSSRAGGSDRAQYLVAAVGDQRRQNRCRAKLPVRARDGAHGLGRRIVVQQNPAATIHLQIDQARREECTGRQATRSPGGRNASIAGHAINPLSVDQDGSLAVPA